MIIFHQQRVRRQLCILLAAAAWLTIHTTTTLADEVGTFTVVKGSVDSLRELANAPIPAQVGLGILMDDVIRTKHRSRTRLKLIDNSVLNMGQDYMMKIDQYVFNADKKIRKGVIMAMRGKVRATVAKMKHQSADSTFEIRTPTAIAAARGTEFIVNVDSSLRSDIIVLDGIVEVRNRNPDIHGNVLVKAGQYTKVTFDQPPSVPEPMPTAQIQMLIRDTTPDSGGTTSSAAAQQLSAQSATTSKKQTAAAATTTVAKNHSSTSAIATQAGKHPLTQPIAAQQTQQSASPVATLADITPVPPPPPLMLTQPLQPTPPALQNVAPSATSTPPAVAQPAVTQLAPSLLTVPVTITFAP